MASQLPDKLLSELHARYTDVAKARVDGDLVLAAKRYDEFEQFCREQTAVTGSPTFLCGLAVITEDDETAIRLFHEAISLARARDESAHDILFPLAVRHFHRDEFELANRYALQSRQDATSAGDHDAVTEADVLLEQIQKHAA